MARRKSPSQFFALALALFITAVYVGIKLSGEQKPEDSPEPSTPDEAAGEPLAYALHATRSDWPPLEEGEGGAAMSAQAGTANYYIVLDGSGSMRRNDCSGEVSKIEAALSALSTFVGAVPGEAHLGLAAFDGTGLSERVPLALDNRESFQQALARIQAKGGTPLRSAIELGYGKLTAQARRQLGYGEYHLVVVTDGHADPESEDPRRIVDRILASSPVVLHTIGFCIGPDHVLNQPGRTYYLAADSPAQLQQGLSGVLAEAPVFDATQFR